MGRRVKPYCFAIVLLSGLHANANAIENIMGLIQGAAAGQSLPAAGTGIVEGPVAGPHTGLIGVESMALNTAGKVSGEDILAMNTTDLMGMGTVGVVTAAAEIQDKQGISSPSDPWMKLKLDDNPDTAGRRIGLGRILPEASVKFGYNDNLTLENKNPIGSFYTRFTPHASYLMSSKTRKLTLDYLVDATVYEGSSTDNYLDNRLRASFDYNPTSRIFASIDGEYLDTHDDRGTGRAAGGAGITQTSLDEWHQWGMGGKFTYGAQTARGRLEFEGKYLNKVYDTNRLFTFTRDKEELTGIGRFFYRIRPKTSLLFEGQMTEHDYREDAVGEPSLDGNTFRLLTGVTWLATFKTTGYAKVGYTFKTFDSARRQDTGAPAWEMGVDWRPKSYSKVHFATAQEYAESDGTGDAIETTRMLMSWEHAWRERFKTTLDFGYLVNTMTASSREDTGYLMGARAEYAFRRWLNLGADFRHSTVDSNDAVFNSDQNIFELTVNLVF